ncbi:MAG: leucine--tRNA ligase [Candidatus Bathyarchaeia archaeon]|nr:leucine--tRNA ligase [Candidatus Bathyarchaeota archaeon]
MSIGRVDWKAIEEKWQKRWNESKIFEVDPDPKREKTFVTFPFAYMNGPLHVGHGFTAVKVDAYARYMRMRQRSVLFPWAWHWTGETIAGASERVKRRDPAIIKEFKELDGVSDEDLERFVDPAYIARYYTEQNRETVKRIGFSIDWRREFHTTSLEPNFSRFIEWQYRRLREGGYVFKGTHPVVWCPNCESPTGDHDRLEGEGASPEEYILIKFRMGESYIPAATFRPETIFGVTNLWINPEAEYVHAKVDEEAWIVSVEAAEKLKDQLRRVEVNQRLLGRELVGATCIDPVTGKPLIILPAWFVDPKSGSGVVYSVPAHAPLDWVALRDLKAKPELVERYGVEKSKIEKIEPIGIIHLEDHGEYPAVEIVEELKVKDQWDPKCEDATKIIYRKEYHTGILKNNCLQYSGMRVQEVKDRIVRDFKEVKIADSMFDLTQKVVCRCTTLCKVKILQDQWFLRYSDQQWKQRTKLLLSRAKVYPESARQWFLDVIDWYRDWPCARKTGLGTPIPWSPEWIIETLSDSTVYMAFYTINKEIRRHNLTPKQLTDEVFDYIFLGEGRLEEVASRAGIEKEVLESMRLEFLYWYPVDLRVSAKELLPNHLTFYLFHHAAIFREEHWPRAIGVNGMLMIEGEKMSKSKGNIVSLRRAIEEHSADIVRVTLLMGGDGMDDPDWRNENLKDITNRLESFMNTAKNIIGMSEGGSFGHLEEWLTSRIHDRVVKVTEHLENLKTRAAAENIIYEIQNDLRWYLRRRGTPNSKVLRRLLETWVRLMAPFAPHISEEVWELLGNEGFVSTEQWPRPEEFEKSLRAELIEESVQNMIEDIKNILRATGKTPRRIILYTAPRWKWRAILRILESRVKGSTQEGVMKDLALDPEIKDVISEAKKFVQTFTKEATQVTSEYAEKILEAGIIDEYSTLKEAIPFLSKEFKAEVEVYRSDDHSKYDPAGRAYHARPYRPAVYIE